VQKSCQTSQQPLIQQVADDGTLQHAYTWLQAQQPGALPHWDQLKSSLQSQLLSGEYCFQPVTLVHTTNRLGEPETQECWQAQDQLVLKAISLVLTDHLKADFSTGCHHLEGRNGIKQAVRQTRDYLQNHPDSWVMKSDVKGYYAHIDHSILYEQFHELFPNEKYLLRLLWQSVKRTVYDGGNYNDVEHGISLGCPLSPLMAALYLKPLDDLFEGTTSNSPPYQGGVGGGLFYVRFMDDLVVMAPTHWQLRSAVARSNLILEQHQLSQAPEKTVIGRVSRGFDFLGYHLTPTQLTVSKTALQRREARLHQLYLPRPMGEGRGEGKEVSRWQQYLPRPLREGRGEGKTADFNPPPRPRIPNKLPFEAQFLALGAASLLGAAASDSHATIWYTDLSSSSSPIRPTGIDLDGDGIIDVIGKTFNGFAKFRADYFIGRVGSYCADAPAAANFALGQSCVAGRFYNNAHNGWSSATPAKHWIKFKTSKGNYGLVRVLVNASLSSMGTWDGYAFDDTGVDFQPSNLPATQNTVNGYPPPQMNVKGNGITIADGATTPATTDHTDFGSVTVGNSVSKTFSVENLGAVSLAITNWGVSGASCTTEFSLVSFASTSIAAGSNSSFVLKYTPIDAGTDTCTINIANNDSTKNPYNFDIRGTGTTLPTYTITLTASGTGTGTLMGSASYTAGATVTLNATPNAGSTFVGWTPCAASFTMPANDLTCTAQFESIAVTPPVVVTPPATVTPAVVVTPPVTVTPGLPENLSLFVQVDGSGRGKVTSDTGLLCQSSDCQVDNNSGALKCNPEACSQVIKTLTTVNLKPVAETGSVFSSWGGHPECIDGQVVMTGGRLCVAYFRKQQASLFLTMEGSGQGQVLVDVGKLDWTSNHEAHTSYNVGTEVGLTATALPGAYFVGWGGNEDCVDGKVVMKAERACVAHFNLNEESTHSLPTEANPTLLPESSAPVTTTPEVPVAATPTVDTAPPSTVEVVPAEVVAQAVVLPPVTLTTGKLGAGNLRSDPTGIDCGETCQAAYPIDTVVTLIATPNEGAMFKEWSGDCNSPELTTTVTLTTDSHCQAMFAEVATTTETTTVPEVIPPPVTTPAVPVTTTVPVMIPVATPVTPAPVPPVVIPAPVIPIQPPILGGASFSCDTTGSINQVCNYGGRPVTELNIQTWGMVSNGVLSNSLVNVGWVSNFTITVKGKLTGGVVTGYIKNFGIMLDFDFKGMSIIGGTLGGVITNTSKVGGFFQDVTLLAGTKITGGTLKGTIKGDKKSPAVLEKVKIKKGSKLSGVKLGKDVKLEKGVVVE